MIFADDAIAPMIRLFHAHAPCFDFADADDADDALRAFYDAIRLFIDA